MYTVWNSFRLLVGVYFGCPFGEALNDAPCRPPKDLGSRTPRLVSYAIVGKCPGTPKVDLLSRRFLAIVFGKCFAASLTKNPGRIWSADSFGCRISYLEFNKQILAEGYPNITPKEGKKGYHVGSPVFWFMPWV